MSELCMILRCRFTDDIAVKDMPHSGHSKRGLIFFPLDLFDATFVVSGTGAASALTDVGTSSFSMIECLEKERSVSNFALHRLKVKCDRLDSVHADEDNIGVFILFLMLSGFMHVCCINHVCTDPSRITAIQ